MLLLNGILFKIYFLYYPLEDRQCCVIIHEIIPVISFFQVFDKPCVPLFCRP